MSNPTVNQILSDPLTTWQSLVNQGHDIIHYKDFLANNDLFQRYLRSSDNNERAAILAIVVLAITYGSDQAFELLEHFGVEVALHAAYATVGCGKSGEGYRPVDDIIKGTLPSYLCCPHNTSNTSKNVSALVGAIGEDQRASVEAAIEFFAERHRNRIMTSH